MPIAWRKLLAVLTLLLPALAQADAASLLAKAQTEDSARYAALVAKGAEFRATSDNQAFTVWWQPAGWKATSGVIVALHGHGAFATSEAYLWQSYAERYGYAVLTLQWWFGGGEATSDYYRPDQMYPLISSLLASKGARAGTVLFTGFSRGSANSYAVAVLDNTPTGRKYFNLVLSNAGTAATGYPPNQQIAAGAFGSLPFSGMKWAMYCGERDPDPTINGCPGMQAAREWVTRYGANVVLFIDDPTGDHGGFMLNSANVESALAVYAAQLAAATAVPTCSVAAQPTTVALGSSTTLTAACVPTASSYTWTGGTCAGTSGAVCSAQPAVNTTYSVIGSNANGAGPAASTSVSVVDGSAPTAPTGLRATAVDARSIRLSWTASTDNVGVTAYKVYRNDTLVGTTGSTSYTDPALAPASSYTYLLIACDAAGNCSLRSSTVSASTPALSDVLSTTETECLFNWAEDAYPGTFLPRRPASQTSAPYTYRRYSGTNLYLGLSSVDNHVYLMDGAGRLTDYGLAAAWAVQAGCR